MNFVKKENNIFKKSLIKSFTNNLLKSKFILGEDVNHLEKLLCKFTNSKYCITTSSGTDALLLSLMSINLKPNDEVITTPFTWVSNAEVIKFLKAKIIFADIDEKTFNIDPKSVLSKINKKTRAVVAVSLFGQCADLIKLKNICKKKKIILIEDAAQSFGAKIKNKNSCSIADISCTSFFPTKILGSLGDGGACFTNNKSISKKIRMLRNHGKNNKGKFDYVGINGRLDTIQASFLILKLRKINLLIKKRIKAAMYYDKEFSNIKDIVKAPHIKNNFKSVFSQYSIIVKKKRNQLFQYLKKKGIDVKIFYLPIYKNNAYREEKVLCPNTEKISKSILSIPISSVISKKYQFFIAKCIKDFYG